MNEQELKNIKQRVIEVVGANAGINPCKVCQDSKVKTELGIDSIKVASLIIDLEDEFGFTVDDGDVFMKNLETVGCITNYVVKKMGAA